MTKTKSNRIKALAAGAAITCVLGGGAAAVLLPSFASASVATSQGADDAVGHLRQAQGADDAVGHIRQARGADDAVGHIRQARGADDAVGHVRHGGDDPVGHR